MRGTYEKGKVIPADSQAFGVCMRVRATSLSASVLEMRVKAHEEGQEGEDREGLRSGSWVRRPSTRVIAPIVLLTPGIEAHSQCWVAMMKVFSWSWIARAH